MAKQIDGTEFACLTINADLEAENEKLKKQLAEKEEQVRKKVCGQIRELTKKQTDFGFLDEKITLYRLFHILEQAEKEMSDVKNS